MLDDDNISSEAKLLARRRFLIRTAMASAAGISSPASAAAIVHDPTKAIPKQAARSVAPFELEENTGTELHAAIDAGLFVNVKDFAAKGDGVTDDTPALRAAVRAATPSHGTILIPANCTIRITSQVSCGAVRIVGASRDTSRILVDFNGIGLYVDADSLSTFEMHNVTVTGEVEFRWSLPTRVKQVGLKISTTHNAVVRNCVFVHVYQGIQLEGGGYHNIIEGNLFRTCLVGVHVLPAYLGDDPNEASILFNQFQLFPRSVGGPGATQAIVIGGASGVKIIGNGIEQCFLGVSLGTSEYACLLANRFEKNTTHITQDSSVVTNMIIGGFIDAGGTITAPIATKIPARGTVAFSGTLFNEAIIAATLSGTWENVGKGSAHAGYHKTKEGIVHLSGTVKDGASSSTIFSLPGGYRPVGDLQFATATSGGYGEIRVASATGAVALIFGGTASVSLNGISFRAA